MSIILNSFVWILNKLVLIVGDYGLAIVLLTLMVKLILLPLSLKQKKDLAKQQSLGKEIERIKEKYKNDAKALEQELGKYQGEYMKSMMGCLTIFMQAPIMMSIYGAVRSGLQGESTWLVPWVKGINLSDPYFFLPVIYIAITMLPSVFDAVYYKAKNSMATLKTTVVMNILFGMLISLKTPIGLVIYLITFSAFSAVEHIVYSIKWKPKEVAA